MPGGYEEGARQRMVDRLVDAVAVFRGLGTVIAFLKIHLRRGKPSCLLLVCIISYFLLSRARITSHKLILKRIVILVFEYLRTCILYSNESVSCSEF